MPSEIDNAWAAGIIDADGCVTLRPSGQGKTRHPQLVVDSTDMEILEALMSLYGGSLTMKKRREEHHRQAWMWRIYGADRVIAILGLLLPHMRCPSKRRRAEMLVNEYRSVTPRNGRYTAEMLDRRYQWQAEFMAVGAGRGSQSIPGAPNH